MAVSVLLAPLQNLLSTFQAERHYRDDKKDAALLAISKALIETKRYIEESGGKKCFDRKAEFNLAQLWADAATKSRHVSGDVAARLHDKSFYWADNLEWSRDEVLKKRIDLDAIHEAIRELLAPQ